MDFCTNVCVFCNLFFISSAGPRSARSARPPKISLFFLLSRSHFRSFSLSGGLLVEFWWCLKRRDPQMCTFGLSGCRVKPRRPGHARNRSCEEQNWRGGRYGLSRKISVASNIDDLFSSGTDFQLFFLEQRFSVRKTQSFL